MPETYFERAAGRLAANRQITSGFTRNDPVLEAICREILVSHCRLRGLGGQDLLDPSTHTGGLIDVCVSHLTERAAVFLNEIEFLVDLRKPGPASLVNEHEFQAFICDQIPIWLAKWQPDGSRSGSPVLNFCWGLLQLDAKDRHEANPEKEDQVPTSLWRKAVYLSESIYTIEGVSQAGGLKVPAKRALYTAGLSASGAWDDFDLMLRWHRHARTKPSSIGKPKKTLLFGARLRLFDRIHLRAAMVRQLMDSAEVVGISPSACLSIDDFIARVAPSISGADALDPVHQGKRLRDLLRDPWPDHVLAPSLNDLVVGRKRSLLNEFSNALASYLFRSYLPDLRSRPEALEDDAELVRCIQKLPMSADLSGLILGDAPPYLFSEVTSQLAEYLAGQIHEKILSNWCPLEFLPSGQNVEVSGYRKTLSQRLFDWTVVDAAQLEAACDLLIGETPWSGWPKVVWTSEGFQRF